MDYIFFKRNINNEISTPARRRFNIREVFNSLKSRYYAIKERIAEAKLPYNKVDRVIKI